MAGLEKIKVKVASEDIVMRDPKSKLRVTTAGMVVEKNPFWLRRIKCGDVILVETYASEIKSNSSEGEQQ